MSNKIEERLLKIKSTIEEAEREEQRINGATDELLKRMEKEYGVETLEDAEAEIARLDKEIAKRDKALNKGVRELEEAHDWD